MQKSFISIAAVVFFMASSNVFAYSGGSGTEASPYQIGTVADWQLLMDTPANWNLHFIMTADVNLYGITLTPVGGQTIKFTGVFDGNSYIIRNAVINQPSNTYVGLFGYLNSGQIKNLGIKNADITGGIFVGGLVGYSYSGSIVSNCYSTGSVFSSASSSFTGGLVGYLNSGTISNSYSTDFVSSSSSSQGSSIGGLVGYLHSGTISNSYSIGSVASSSLSSSYTGGLVGHLYSGTISSSYSTGFVSADSSSISIFYPPYAGGLVGALNSGTILNSYSTGSVSSTAPYISAYAGGLVGDLEAGTISNCYSTGFVSSSLPSHIGGLVGYNPSGTVTASFWDTQTSGQPTSAGGTGLPTADMQDENTFLIAGWDFTTPVWEICNSTNYPKLAWQIPLSGDFGCPDGVDIYDLAVFVDQWLLEQPSYDIAPAGGDGIVNFLDFAVFANDWQGDMTQLSEFISQWLQQSAYNADIAPAPNGDGIVNMLDFAVFAENWLAEN